MTTSIKFNVPCTVATQWKWCDLVVRTQDMYIERIYYDNNFWTTVIEKLREFYFTAILPELLFPLGGSAICEPSKDFKRDWQDIVKSL